MHPRPDAPHLKGDRDEVIPFSMGERLIARDPLAPEIHSASAGAGHHNGSLRARKEVPPDGTKSGRRQRRQVRTRV